MRPLHVLLAAGLLAVSILAGRWLAGPRPIAAGADAAALPGDGQRLYLMHCAKCHAADGRGDPAMRIALRPPPRDFAARPWRGEVSIPAIRQVIQRGIPGTAMLPAEGQFSDRQLDALAAHVLTLAQRPASAVDDPSTADVPGPTRGEHPATSELERVGFRWIRPAHRPPQVMLTASGGQTADPLASPARPTLLHFWGTTCIHCLGELAQMQRRVALHGDLGFDIVSICVDTTDIQAAADVAQRVAPGHPVYVDPLGLAGQKFGVSALPAFRLVGADGRLRAAAVGSLDWSDPATVQAIRESAAADRLDSPAQGTPLGVR